MKMMLAGLLLLPAVALAQLPAAAGGVNAASLNNRAHNDRAQQHRSVATISPTDAASMAQKQYGGKVLGVTQTRINGHLYYQVKLLSHGRIQSVRIPAQ